MAASELWPPLEEVRQWAEDKISTEKAPPLTTGKYKNLIALIDEILASKAEASIPDDSRNHAEQARHR